MDIPIANILNGYGWIIIIAVILLFFGGSKIPELMRGMGQGVGALKKGLEEGRTSEADDQAKK